MPYDKDMIKGAPNNDAGEPLSETDEQELYSYYGSRRGQTADGADQPAQAAAPIPRSPRRQAMSVTGST